MRTLRTTRPTLCLLLAVATALVAVVPARACVCPPLAKTPVGAPVAPPAKPCCPPAAKHACCASASTGAAKASCCDHAPIPTDAPGCHCPRCDCDAPAAPPAPTAPAPTAPQLDDATPSIVPPSFVSGPPTTAAHAARSVPTIPPTDLVISLARLTC